MASAGVWMLVAVALVLVVTGLPSWLVLTGVAMVFAAGGAAGGLIPPSLLTALPGRLLGLLENDLLQALPLFVLMGVLLDRLPLAGILFRVGQRALRWTGAGEALSALSLAALLAPMNGSVGASALMLGRTVQPRLDANGVPRERSAALVCVASTLGIVVPPSLVLILLGDAMMRAHTEAVNATRESTRIINTQDVFAGALVPALLLFLLTAFVAWRFGRRTARPDGRQRESTRRGEWVLAGCTLAVVVTLLAGVTFGYLFAVEAAAAGGVALFAFGLATRSLPLPVVRDVVADTMAISGALFALLMAATVFTLVLRAFGTDRWLADIVTGLPEGGALALTLVLAILAVCGLVLDAFEMIFVVVPIVMPPLLMVVRDATWVSVLTLLILQASFLIPPFGYALLLTRQVQARPLPLSALTRALVPYLAAQWLVVALVATLPDLVWQRNPTALPAPPAGVGGEDAGRDAMIEQLNRLDAEQPSATERGK
ncbi:MAG: TRAP transporter large permease subunit [Burkholderiales bacterium]